MSTETSTKRCLEAGEESQARKKPNFAIHPYLYFAGNANEAVDFYADVFNAEVPVRMTYGASPCPEPVAEELKDKICHAMLTFGNTVIMISDNFKSDKEGCEGEDTVFGNSVQLSIDMADLEEMKRIFNKLAEGGKVVMPVAPQFWNATFGKLVDKFGVHWGLNVDHPVAEEKKEEGV